MGAHSTIISAQRRVAIEAEIETHLQRVTILIARLDRADAPFDDLEPEQDAAIDDGPCDQGPCSLLPHRPIYGLDQSRGPINEREAYWAWQRGDPRKFAHRA